MTVCEVAYIPSSDLDSCWHRGFAYLKGWYHWQKGRRVILEPSVHPYGSFWLDVVDKGVKALAVVVAAVWTYFRADTYRRKVEPSVSGELFDKDGEHYAAITCSLKNLGQSKYIIRQKGTYLSAEALRPAGREPLDGSEVFKLHGWIEPGEQIDEPLILRIPNPSSFVGLKVNLRVISEKMDWDGNIRNIEWNASCILRETTAAVPTRTTPITLGDET